MRRFVNFVLIIIILVFLFMGCKELYMFYDKELEDQTLMEMVMQVPVEEDLSNQVETEDETASPVDDPLLRKVDFVTLKTINPDIVGWIYIPDTKINYPILQGKDNRYYLNHDYKKRYSQLGSIFTYHDADMENDEHLAFFGHNMISGQSFASLHDYKKSAFAKSHTTMYIYTPGKVKKCTLISHFGCYKTDVIFDMSADILAQDLAARSDISYEIPSHDGQILTLATCNGYEGTNKRYVVNFIVTEQRYVLF